MELDFDICTHRESKFRTICNFFLNEKCYPSSRFNNIIILCITSWIANALQNGYSALNESIYWKQWQAGRILERVIVKRISWIYTIKLFREQQRNIVPQLLSGNFFFYLTINDLFACQIPEAVYKERFSKTLIHSSQCCDNCQRPRHWTIMFFMITASVTRSRNREEFLITILLWYWRFGETFFVNSFEEFDKQINFSSEQCVDFKKINGKIKE